MNALRKEGFKYICVPTKKDSLTQKKISFKNGITVSKQHSVTNLLHWAVDGEGLVHIGGLGPTALAPDDHCSCCVELLFKLHILLPDSHAAFSKLPAFLPIKTHPFGQQKEFVKKYKLSVFLLVH